MVCEPKYNELEKYRSMLVGHKIVSVDFTENGDEGLTITCKNGAILDFGFSGCEGKINLTKGDNMLPGNNLKDNWYMAHNPHPMFNLKDLLDSFDNFDTSFKIQNEEGKPIYIRMSGKAGVIIIDSFKD